MKFIGLERLVAGVPMTVNQISRDVQVYFSSEAARRKYQKKHPSNTPPSRLCGMAKEHYLMRHCMRHADEEAREDELANPEVGGAVMERRFLLTIVSRTFGAARNSRHLVTGVAHYVFGQSPVEIATLCSLLGIDSADRANIAQRELPEIGDHLVNRFPQLRRFSGTEPMPDSAKADQYREWLKNFVPWGSKCEDSRADHPSWQDWQRIHRFLHRCDGFDHQPRSIGLIRFVSRKKGEGSNAAASAR